MEPTIPTNPFVDAIATLLGRYHPFQRPVAFGMMTGHDAVSSSVYERDDDSQPGPVDYVIDYDADGLVAVEFVAQGETQVQSLRCPLIDVLRIVLSGGQIRSISRPDPSAMYWTAMARLDSDAPDTRMMRGTPLPSPRRRLIVGAEDRRGIAAALHSRIPLRPEARSALGPYLVGRVSGTQIPGLRGRLDEAKRSLGKDFANSIVGAVYETLADPIAASGEDGGPPMNSWVVRSQAVGSSAWEEVASSVHPVGKNAVPRRERRLGKAVVRHLESDAFGTGIDSPRSSRSMVPLDFQFGSEEEALTLEDILPGDLDISRLVETSDLIDSAGLTDRQRDVFLLQYSEDLTQAEIAQRLGIAVGTVAATSSRARVKLKKIAPGP